VITSTERSRPSSSTTDCGASSASLH